MWLVIISSVHIPLRNPKLGYSWYSNLLKDPLHRWDPDICLCRQISHKDTLFSVISLTKVQHEDKEQTYLGQLYPIAIWWTCYKKTLVLAICFISCLNSYYSHMIQTIVSDPLNCVGSSQWTMTPYKRQIHHGVRIDDWLSVGCLWFDFFSRKKIISIPNWYDLTAMMDDYVCRDM